MLTLFTRPPFPERGKIRLFVEKTSFIPTPACRYNFVDDYIICKDRSLQEWLDFINEYRKPVFSVSTFECTLPPIPVYTYPNIPDMFFHRSIIADELESLFQRNMRYRWIARKWIQKIRCRIMNRRFIGETDLASLSPIPDKWKVEVFDYASKSKYCFHAASIQKYMLESLFTNNFAFAFPKCPKNPYTNIPWNVGQLIAIVEQVQNAFFRNQHKFCDDWIIRYRQTRYDLTLFEEKFNPILQCKAARAFFGEPANLLFHEVYRDAIDDIFDNNQFPRGTMTYSRILDRTLKRDLMAQWDELVLYSFLHVNHGIFPPDSKYQSEDDLESAIYSVYMETLHTVNMNKAPIFIRSSSVQTDSLA